nr:hypothetical protein [Mycobacterium uberis]
MRYCLLGQDFTGRRVEPGGTYYPDMCPRDCYPRSDGSWFTIAMANDVEWHRLLLGVRLDSRPAW